LIMRFNLSLLVILATTTYSVAQPPPPPPGPGGSGPRPMQKIFPPTPGSPGGGMIILGLPDEQLIDDPRPFLAGMLAKPKSRDMDPKALKDLMDKLKKMPKDQQPDKAQLDEILKNPAFKDPKFLEQLEKMLRDPNFPKNIEGSLPEGAQLPEKGQGPELADKLKDLLESGKPGGGQPDVPDAGNPGKIDPSLPPPSTGPSPDAKNPYADSEWVKWMEKNFGDSPAAQDAVKDLLNSLQKGDMKGMFDDVPGLKNNGWKDFADWGKSNGLDMSKVRPPDVSTGKSGSIMSGGGGGSSSIGGGLGGGSGGGGAGLSLGGGGPALLVIAGIAGAFLLGLMLFRRWKIDQARRMAQGAGGPNGFDYDSIRTREELVRAFDHVSLNQIGEEARSWNHRVIADQFVEVKPAQAEPANELAGLYERARYAPLDEDLSTGDFADARRDLRAIAEIPA
jgi:hypothetical protein